MLYHVSVTRIKRGILRPRVPEQIIKGENNTIKRICFCNSIKKCISAMPGGIQIVENLVYLFYELKVAPLLYVYSIDEKGISINNIVYPVKVKNYVIDVPLTNEHWITNQDVKCSEILIGVVDLKHEYVQIPHTKVQINFVKNIKYIRFDNLPILLFYKLVFADPTYILGLGYVFSMLFCW